MLSSLLALSNSSTDIGLTPDLVKSYLTSHHDLLEEYVMESVEDEELSVWLNKKRQNCNAATNLESLSFAKPPVVQEKFSDPKMSQLQRRILKDFVEGHDQLPRMYELANACGTACCADGCSFYVLRAGGVELYHYLPTNDESEYQLRLSGPVSLNSTVAAHVAKTGETVIVKDLLMDDRFPKGVGVEGSLIQSVLCIPITLPSDDLICVIELTRGWGCSPFTDREFQIASTIAAFTGCLMYQGEMNQTLIKQMDLNDFLLGVSKIIFDDIVTIDQLVETIMVYTKELVQAERCAMFLVDEEQQELYSNLLDDGRMDEAGNPIFTKGETIRFPITKGIAGHVAETGEVVNIPEAYNDPRFNRDIDQETGFTTRSILCMPIISRGTVIGVVEMINKIGDVFSKADESSFKMFAVYCALALHYAKLYGEMKLKTAQLQVAVEQFSFHSKPSEKDVKVLIAKPRLHSYAVPEDLDSYYFYGAKMYGDVLIELFVEILDKMFGPDGFPQHQLIRFLLTVKKNYRPVSYHNWAHGFNVAHCTYCILLRIRPRELLPELREKAMLIAALCHDVDHRGFNNTFFVKTGQPLAQLYDESIMEEHHYMQTVAILQQDGNNIFSNLNSEDYKHVLQYMHHAIIATDLALFFPNQKKLATLLLEDTLDIENNLCHMNGALSLVMTAVDLIATCKPWSIHYMITCKIYEEFYMQGDLEKERGLTPVPMMDRNNVKNIPVDQIGFLKFVCFPCYITLYDIFPQTAPLLEGCRDNMMQWEHVIEGTSITTWEPAKSLVLSPADSKKNDPEEQSAAATDENI